MAAEEKREARVWVGSDGKVIIEREWWFWDGREEVLRDRTGRKREGREGERSGEERRSGEEGERAA